LLLLHIGCFHIALHVREETGCTQAVHTGCTHRLYTQAVQSGCTHRLYTQAVHSGCSVRLFSQAVHTGPVQCNHRTTSPHSLQADT
jgi:hypothetical protein